MKNPEHHKNKSVAHPCHPCPQSLTLEEIRMRLMVNSMKIKIEQQRLLTAILPGATPVETAVMSNISRFETLLQYATLAVTTYRMAKKGVDFVKSFKK